MLLRRLGAMLIALVLLVGITACESKQTTDSSTLTQSAVQDQETSSSFVSSGDQSNLDVPQQDSTERVESSEDTSINSSHDVDNSQSESEESQPVSSDESKPQDTIIKCEHGDEDPYIGVSKSQFYADYTIACCNQDAAFRSKHGLLSGRLDVPGQYVTETENRPQIDGVFVRNTAAVYSDDGATYIVFDAKGKETMRIYKAGGYITLEEVAAYMYAFGGSGQIPANYTTKKNTKPSSSMWGEYLRVNHSYFIGDTDKYPYEPELPNITGCGGSLRYYEMDIGTTGTETPGYPAKPYIQGSKINRGAARIVYTRYDLNGNGVYETDEVYVFYTHNHYNDFREYLNYYGGWGEMFGNVTGGGEYSSETRANPTPYVSTAYDDFTQ